MKPVALASPSNRACIVLGGSTHSTLSAVRSVASLGIPTFAGTLQRSALGLLSSSRWCAGSRHITGADSAGLANELARFADSEFPDATRVLVISTSERLIDHLDRARNLLDPRFDLSIPPEPVCQLLLDKAISLRLAEHAGLQVPQWVALTSRDDLGVIRDLRFPVCARPTAWSTKGTQPFKIRVCPTVEAAIDCVGSGIDRGGTYIVQEYMGEADGLDVGMIWTSPDGSTQRCWTGRKQRSSSVEGGVLAWGESIDLPDVAAALQTFTDSIGFRGVGGIEFLRHRDDVWFIEFNPRLEAFHRLAALSGFDAPALVARDWIGESSDERETARKSAAFWVGSAWTERVARDPGATCLLLGDAARFLHHRPRGFSVWSVSDPMPTVVACRSWLARRVRQLVARRRRVHTRAPVG